MTMTGHVLLVDPESELVFTLSHNEATPRCSMTFRHGGGTDEFIAFKVGKSTPGLVLSLRWSLKISAMHINNRKK
jgi:hypothetical protein